MTTTRCPIYWQLMLARDTAAASLEELRRAKPGSASAARAESILDDAIEKQTAHLHECSVCGVWRAEMKKLAERPMEGCEE